MSEMVRNELLRLKAESVEMKSGARRDRTVGLLNAIEVNDLPVKPDVVPFTPI
jgi:hypothetical protein